MVQVNRDGRVKRHSVMLEELMKSLTWYEDNEGTKPKTLPLRDLRLFLPNRIRKPNPNCPNQVLVLGNHNRSKEIGLPAIMPRPKAKIYILDLAALKLICRQDRVDILYSADSGSNRR